LADINGIMGDEGILDLLTWREGKYSFEPRIRVTERNVGQPIEALVIRGVQLVDKVNFIKNVGLIPDSVLQRRHTEVGAHDFDSMAARDNTQHTAQAFLCRYR
jgi:hypothetical protein